MDLGRIGGCTMTAPRIRRLWDGSVELTFPYSAFMVDSLKLDILPAQTEQLAGARLSVLHPEPRG